jgi:hypothetical protein
MGVLWAHMAEGMEGFMRAYVFFFFENMRAYADHLIETWAKYVQSSEVGSTKFIYNMLLESFLIISKKFSFNSATS